MMTGGWLPTNAQIKYLTAQVVAKRCSSILPVRTQLINYICLI